MTGAPLTLDTLPITHHFAGGVYGKEMFIPKGHYAVKHQHAYAHLSILAQGIAEVNVNGAVQTYVAPACITIAAGATHTITAATDIVWFCIHATDETDPAKVDQVLIGQGA